MFKFGNKSQQYNEGTKWFIQKQDFIKQPQVIVDIPLNISPELLDYSINIRGIKDVNIKGIITYHPNLNAINIVATIIGEVVVEDDQTLKHFAV
ncbi:MAG: hypothetical protein OHM56_04755 [Spiroplasma phoeniceum]|nr:MAG: hypothetical protein OHM57_04155 [Spiroplasma phoeniceum]UZQ33250.1 MAG: hypothetical protein OHM56_04755 [Spiroplasma phoeniceum]